MNWWDTNQSQIFAKKEEWDAVLEAYADKEGHGWIRAACPICEEECGTNDKKLSLGLNTRTGGYNCCKCEMTGKLPESYRARLDYLIVLEDDTPKPEAKKIVEPAPNFVELFSAEGLARPDLDSLRAYCTDPKTVLNAGGKPSRGLPLETARAMRIGAADGFKCSGRIIVPILDAENSDGPWRGWFGRDATGLSKWPHLYSKGMNRLGLLWNESALYVDTDEFVFGMEGALDGARVWPDAFGFLGKPLVTHIPIIRRTKRPVVMCLDGDAWRKGQEFSWNLALHGIRSANIRLPPKSDPDDTDRSWLYEEARRLL